MRKGVRGAFHQSRGAVGVFLPVSNVGFVVVRNLPRNMQNEDRSVYACRDKRWWYLRITKKNFTNTIKIRNCNYSPICTACVLLSQSKS